MGKKQIDTSVNDLLFSSMKKPMGTMTEIEWVPNSISLYKASKYHIVFLFFSLQLKTKSLL
uniref:Uncharacterized protein n=2 Tax=Metallosphaera hakonensis TaxID=79601 RepID=A0A2U9IRK8_9CREN